MAGTPGDRAALAGLAAGVGAAHPPQVAVSAAAGTARGVGQAQHPRMTSAPAGVVIRVGKPPPPATAPVRETGLAVLVRSQGDGDGTMVVRTSHA